MTGKHRRFIEEYLIDYNATRAAIRAGYSRKTARQQGQRLLTKADIATEIATRAQTISARAEIDAERVIRGLADIAFSSPKHLFDSNGKPVPLEDLPDHAAVAVKKIKLRVPQDDSVAIILEVTFWDKLGALKALAERTGMSKRPSEKRDTLGDAILAPAKPMSVSNG